MNNHHRMPFNRCAWIFAAVFLIARPALATSLPDFTTLVQKYGDAVVNISTTTKRREATGPQGYNMPDIPKDSPFYQFFKKYFNQIPQGQGQAPYEERSSLGSGFIISPDGYVITNDHVVAGADQVTVSLVDRREFKAKVVGADKRSDIAVLKINGHDLPVVKLGDSSKLKVGEWVLAIGSPFGFDHSATAGIVSAMGRSLPNENYIPFIQTDVAINPGNSGGPLFDLDGDVIGVNSQIYSRTGGFMGLSFAVPINVVANVYKQLRATGHVSRGWLGVLIQDVTKELAESFGMDRPHGALVAKVLPDSPAAKAGLEVGDVVVAYDGNDVETSSDLPPMVGSTTVGSKVPLDIIRRGKKLTLTIQIAKLPEQQQVASEGGGTQGPGASNPLNVEVRDLTDEERSKMDLKDQGVRVEQVFSGPGQDSGIRKGDVILQLNNTKIKDARQFEELADKLPKDKSIPILVQRSGNPIFLAFKLSKSK